MQVMGVTGRIYGLKSGQTTNGKDKVTFRIGVRKEYVTDQDKQDKKTLVFMPMIAMGPTAKFISTYFNEGDNIAIGSMEYGTFRSQNAPNEYDDMHSFKINKAGFVSDGQQGGGAQTQPQRQAPAPQTQQQNQYQAPPQQQQQQNFPPPAASGVYVSDDDLPF